MPRVSSTDRADAIEFKDEQSAAEMAAYIEDSEAADE